MRSLACIQGRLRPTPPFDFARSLAFLGEFMPTAGEQRLEAQSLVKAVLIDGQAIVFAVCAAPGSRADAPAVDYTAWAAKPISLALKSALEERLAFFLSLDDDLRPFYALAEADPAFQPVVAALYGYHQVKFLTPFENTCWAILTQRTPMRLAHKLKHALTEKWGARLDVDGHVYWAFPEAGPLAAAGAAELLAVVGNARKAEYLAAAARAFAAVDEQFLRAGPYAQVEAWLRAIKGIGAWSAAFVLLRGLGRMERVPVGEARLAEAVARRYGQISVEAAAAGYGPYQGYWAHYLRASS